MYKRSRARLLALLAAFLSLPLAVFAKEPVNPPAPPSIMFKVRSTTERLEMTVNTSRILTMGQKIPQAQVNNPDILDLTPLSPTQVQISGKAAGVTQVNLWNEDQKLHTIDVIVYGDARELAMILKSTFPSAAIDVKPVGGSILVSGFVDQPEHIDRIIQIAEQYYPKVINNMTIGGVQQVLLHVKVMEVSRTKLRQLGFDWAKITGSSAISSSPNGLVTDYNPEEITSLIGKTAYRSASPSTFAFNATNGANGFYGVLEALRQDNLMKIMAEPTVTAINGQMASFNSGGEIPIPVPQSLGTLSVEWKQYGTQVTFVPIVLGNGKIRLEVRPRVSELDETHSTTIGGTTIPGIKTRDVSTSVELEAGQTLALAGLVQTRIESQNAGLPWISEVPYLGAAFRNVKETKNEVELLILVTPELVEAMDADEVPQCGPGMQTTSPSDWELYMKGHLEVPNCCPGGNGCNGGCSQGGVGPEGLPPEGMILGPNEPIPSPPPTDASRARGLKPSNSYGRYSPPKPTPSMPVSVPGSPNSPPGFIGPVGYDVVE